MTTSARRTLAVITRTFAEAGYPLRVTSTDRTPAQNRRVGGVEGSLHLAGKAADVVPEAWWNDPRAYTPIADFCVRLGASRALVEDDHVHLEFR